MDKYVVSSTLGEPDWTNTTVIGGDPLDELERLKNAPGKDIVQYGFGQLSFTLMKHGLLDELRLWMHPLFVGSAEPDDLLYPRPSHRRVRARRQPGPEERHRDPDLPVRPDQRRGPVLTEVGGLRGCPLPTGPPGFCSAPR
jgi:dihydrofolate reductase